MSSPGETSPGQEVENCGEIPESPVLSRQEGSKRVDGKLCGVCGDRALGYNFNAITCESCKAFFRRNALKNKEYRCPFNDECDVTAITRRFCQRCRLRKCFEIGMRKDWIMTDEEKKKKRKKIEENRARKSGGGMGMEDFYVGDATPSGLDDQFQYCDADADHPESFLPYSPDENDADENSRTSTSSSADFVLSLRSPSGSSSAAKPKAVVVGRVRGEDSEPKMMKTRHHSDVHSPKIETGLYNLTSNSVNLEGSCSNFSSSHNIPPTTGTIISMSMPTQVVPPQPATSYQHQHHHSIPPQHHSSNDGLVAGLLRAKSQESAEHHATGAVPTSSNKNCQSGRLNSTTVIVKNEKEDYGINGGYCEPSSLSSLPLNTPTSHPSPSFYTVCARLSCPEERVVPAPDFCIQECSDSPNQQFEFNIRDVLSAIQPEPRDKKVSNSSTNSVMDSIVNLAVQAEYLAPDLIMSNSYSLDLNEAETKKISELLEASEGLNSPLCEDPNFKDLPNPSLINVINLTEIAIRRLIKMAKKISAFKKLCQEDQIALLKGGCTEMMILRSVSAYDPDKDVWKIQQDHQRFKDIKLNVLEAAPGNVYKEHKRFILSFEPEWRHDTNIIALLAAVALFTPERSNVTHPEAVRHEQGSYLYLLKRYLECRYGGCEGKTNYHKLLRIIGHLHVLNDEHVRVFLEVNPRDVEPLLIEIFDLKQS